MLLFIGYVSFMAKNKHFFLTLIASNLLDMEVKPAIVSGITSNGLKYNITSETLENYIANFFYNSNINFTNPVVNIENDLGQRMKINAKSAEYDSLNRLFHLTKGVEATGIEGFSLKVPNITADIDNSTMYSNSKMVATLRDMYLYAKGFNVVSNLTNIEILAPVKISDKNISTAQLDKDLAIYNRIFLKTTQSVFIDNTQKILWSEGDFLIWRDHIRVTGNKFKVYYTDMANNNAMSNILKIEAQGNLLVFNTNNNGLLKGDKYIFDAKKNLMIITAIPYDVTYEDLTYKLTAKDRFEYNIKEHFFVARGKSNLTLKDDKGTLTYDISSDLLYVKMDDEDTEILSMELFDDIVLKSTDETRITANYGYYDAKNKVFYLEDNPKIYYNDGTAIESCKIVWDMLEGNAKLIPCHNQKQFSSKVKKEDLKKK